MLNLRRSAMAVLFAFAALPGLANAGLFDDKEAREAILDLRAKITALTAKLDAKLDEKADKNSALELSSQNDALRAEMASLRGQVEVLINDMQKAQKRQQDFYLDLDKRIRALEPKKVTVDGQEVAIEQSEQRTYDAAMILYKAGQYPNAVSALSNFVSAYPDSIFTSQAQYWLGNAYYALRDCKNTIVALQSLVSRFPDNAKAPDAMLNVASCQLELKDKKGSRKTLEAVIAGFPKTEAAKAAKNLLPSTK
ncbi:MAG: tol-pal system protein YbgF [Undibacterium sp.]|nr:tol-pal system protein YbgF [Undibacterium sp.]